MAQKILSFILSFALSTYALASLPIPHYEPDTLQISTKEGSIISPDIVNRTLEDTNRLPKAHLFHHTGYALANAPQQNPQFLSLAISYLSIAYAYYDALPPTEDKASCLEHIAIIQYELFKYELSIQYFAKAIEVYSQLQIINTENIAAIYSNIGYVHFNTYRYDNALQAFTKSYEYYMQTQNLLAASRAYYNKALVFADMELLDSSLAYFEKSLDIDVLMQNRQEIMASYNNIAVVHTKLHNYNQALSYLEKFYSYINKTDKNSTQLAAYYINLGNIYFYKKQYEKSKECYTHALRIKQEQADNNGIAITLHNLARSLMAQNKLNDAQHKLNEALLLTETVYANSLYAHICLTASNLYERMNKHDKALQYYELFVKNSLSILSDNGGQIFINQYPQNDNFFLTEALQREVKMQKMLASYDLKIKQDSLQTLEAKRKQDRIKTIISIAILIFILLLVVILLSRYITKKRENIKLESQNKEIEEHSIIIAQQSQEILASNKELEKLSVVASKTDSAILIANAEGYFEWTNAAYTKMFGYTFDELCSTISPHIISNGTPDYIIEKYNECRDKKTTVSYELKTKNKAKEDVWVQVSLTPILQEDGEIHKLVMVDTDITELKNAEFEILSQKERIEQQKEEQALQRDNVLLQSTKIQQQKEELNDALTQLKAAQDKLIQSEKMAQLGGLVAGISHEINTPVGVGIAASSSLVSRTEEIVELFESKKMKLSDLQVFLESVQYACDLTLKNLSRTAELVKSFNQISVDNMTEQKREFNVQEYLQDIINSLAPKFRGRHIETVVECSSDIVFTSYPGAIAQIFTNFIINSLLHGFGETEKGTIQIRVQDLEHDFEFIYTDDGKGIASENKHKIFEAFYTTNNKEGTGLGMNITYNLIVQKFKGSIRLESELGKGVTFIILIPKSEVLA